MTKVVDASALAALIFDEPDAERVAQRLHGSPLAAPSLLWYELANVCATKCRRNPADRGSLIARFERGLRFPVATRNIDQTAVLDLALEANLTAYDANYLRLALDLHAELVTLDKALGDAWARNAGS